jgi:(E)-4-hydroxy-3-methylbut-2-enyl-diphosphate synthase
MSGNLPVKKRTRAVRVGELTIGGNAPVSIQSMTNLPIDNVRGTVEQINELQRGGADLVRLAVRNEASIKYLREIRSSTDIPLAADVHFNFRIAIRAIKAGIDKIRINPGNMGKPEQVREIIRAASDYGVPIRIGVNSGSIDLDRYKYIKPETLVQSALDHIRIFEDSGFSEIVVSLKSSDIFQTIEANRLFSKVRDYPLHIGLTEAGYGVSCIVQSSIAIGHLLLEGIGDTIRVSMTGDPVDEVEVARKILESVGMRIPGIRMISCPTCGRMDPSINILELVQTVESELTGYRDRLRDMGKTLTIAVMGCEVNGPGEAAHADVGVAGGGGGSMLLFSRGKKLKRIKMNDVISALVVEVEKIMDSWVSEVPK